MTQKPKVEPLPPSEYGVLRGLLVSESACRWVEDMGIPITIFHDKRARAIAQWAMTRECRGLPVVVEDAFRRAEPEAFSILEWLVADMAAETDFKPEWGTRDVLRFARALFPRWFPGLMRDMAAQVEQSPQNAESALEHLGRVIEFLAGGDE